MTRVRITHPAVIVAVAALVVLLGITAAGRGLSYIGPTSPDSTPASLASVHNIMPLPGWAAVWLAVGLLLVVSIVLRPVYIPVVIIYGMLQMMWAGSFFAATFNGTSDRGWVTGMNYLPEVGIALLLVIIGPLPRLDTLWTRRHLAR